MLTLRRMTEGEFAEYMAVSVPQFADAKMKGEGHDRATADRIARDAFAALLPQGLDTPDHYLFTVVEGRQPVGILWIAQKKLGRRDQIFIYDIEMQESQRGRGYGEQTLKLVEAEARKRGVKEVGLHVFGYNTGAHRLYERMGFRPTNITMVKDLSQHEQ